MESQVLPFHKRTLVWWAGGIGLALSGFELWLLWGKANTWTEFSLALIPNFIAGALTFLAVDFVIERKDARDRYIGAMKSIRLAAKEMKSPLSEQQVQDLMVTSVHAISTLYFGTGKPPCSGQQFENKSCTNCPNTPQPANDDGTCSRCNEIPECWSVRA